MGAYTKSEMDISTIKFEVPKNMTEAEAITAYKMKLYGDYEITKHCIRRFTYFRDSIALISHQPLEYKTGLQDDGYSKVKVFKIVSSTKLPTSLEPESTVILNLFAQNSTYVPRERFNCVIDTFAMHQLGDDSPYSIADAYFRIVRKTLAHGLNNGNRVIFFSFLQESFVNAVLKYFPSRQFFIRINKASTNMDLQRPIFIIVLIRQAKRSSKLTFVAETNFFKAVKHHYSELSLQYEIKSIRSLYAYRYALNVEKASFVNANVMVTDKNNYLLYTISAHNIPQNGLKHKFMVFVIPFARDGEFYFVSHEGRRILSTEMLNCERVVLVNIFLANCRKTESQIENDLYNKIVFFKQDDLPADYVIPFVHCDRFPRRWNYRQLVGSSHNGMFAIDHVFISATKGVKKLVFIDKGGVLQGEVKVLLNPLDTEINGPIIPGESGCYYQKWMVAMMSLPPLEITTEKKVKILILGFAPGCMTGFIFHYFPQAIIVGCDIDIDAVNLSFEAFGLDKGRKQMTISIRDAEDDVFLRCKNNEVFDYVFLDINSENLMNPLDLPPGQFLSTQFFREVKKLIPHGMFIFTNGYYAAQVSDEKVCRLLHNVNKVFPMFGTYRLLEHFFEVVFCWSEFSENVKPKNVRESLEHFNRRITKVSEENSLSVPHFMETVKMYKATS